MRLRGSTQIAIAAIAIGGGGYYGWQLYSARTVDGLHFSELRPGKFNIVGINTGAGYKIIVSNEIAQVVETSGADQLDVGNIEDTTGGGDSGTKRRVPLRELLQSLQGDTVALGKLVTTMNDRLRAADMPGTEIAWQAADLQKAIDGDPVLLKKLEADINVKLDGTPLDQIHTSALFNGIVIHSFVPIKVSVAGVQKTLMAPIVIPFKPNFMQDVERTIREDFNPRPEKIKGNYLQLAQNLIEHPNQKQDVKGAILSNIDEKTLIRLYADIPTRILSNARIILTEDFIESAELSEVEAQHNTKLYDLALNLTPEGRNRLWQFSRRGNIGAQLLVINKDGVAIAAPRIRHELAQSSVSITQLPEKGLAQETADFLNKRETK